MLLGQHSRSSKVTNTQSNARAIRSRSRNISLKYILYLFFALSLFIGLLMLSKVEISDLAQTEEKKCCVDLILCASLNGHNYFRKLHSKIKMVRECKIVLVN